jgi:outer membrane protein assembly factor BamB
VTAAVLCLLVPSCRWTQYRFGPSHTGHNPFEAVIGPDNVAQLQEAWAGQQLGHLHDPVVAEGKVFVGSSGSTGPSYLSALDRDDGTARWTVSFPAPKNVGAPTYANGRLFARITTVEEQTLNAYRASDGALVWSSAVPGHGGPPVIVDGVVYLAFTQLDNSGFTHGWRAFDADTGAVLFGTAAPGFGAFDSSVAEGILYTGQDAYDASGVTNCSGGPPKVCSPLWSYEIEGDGSSPAIANDLVFVASYPGHITALPAHGCGAPTCGPVWTAVAGDGNVSQPAVADGIVYFTSEQGLLAFAASGCGAPTCVPLWTGAMEGTSQSPPSVANGVVFAGSVDDRLHAFDARGCDSGVCPPLWSSVTFDVLTTPVVANGTVYVGLVDSRLHAYRHPVG